MTVCMVVLLCFAKQDNDCVVSWEKFWMKETVYIFLSIESSTGSTMLVRDLPSHFASFAKPTS